MRRRRTLAIILTSYQLGGSERQLASLIEHRTPRAMGVDLHTVTFLKPTSETIARRFEAAGVENTLIDRSSRTFGSFFAALVLALRRIRPGLVLTVLDSSVGAWGRLAAWIARVPAIAHSDQSLMEEGTRAHRLLRPFLDRITCHFFPNAESIAARLVRNGIPAARITVVPTAIDLTVFDPGSVRSLRSAWGIPDEAVVAGFVGRFSEVKRIDILLRAVLALPEESRPDYVALAGDGPSMPDIQEMVDRDPWLRERCLLLGAIDEVPEFMASIDYLVLSSRIEGLPNVVLEAMAMARPVVATRVADVPRLVEGCGFLAEPLDTASLSSAIGAMQALSAGERHELGLVGRRRVERDFDLQRVAATFWDAQMQLLDAGPRGLSNDPEPS